ncbi:MAG: hypothetical protein WBC98_06070 [Candidatus Zixiibacteriota bacterium]
MDCLLSHELKKGTFSISRKMDCFSCHHPMETSSCQDCHQVQSRMFSGEAVLNYQATPDVMSFSLGCGECHVELEQGKTKERVREACGNCHDENYAEMMDQWQEEVSAQINSIKGKIENLKEALDRSKESQETEESLRSALEYSEVRLSLVEKDGSQGGHNYVLISEMLEDAASRLEDAEQLIQ